MIPRNEGRPRGMLDQEVKELETVVEEQMKEKWGQRFDILMNGYAVALAVITYRERMRGAEKIFSMDAVNAVVDKLNRLGYWVWEKDGHYYATAICQPISSSFYTCSPPKKDHRKSWEQ